MTYDAAHSVEDSFGMLSRMDMTVIMVMRSVAVYMCMRVFVTILIYMRVLMKVLVRMSMTMFMII